MGKNQSGGISMKTDYHTRFKQARLYAAQVRARREMGDRYEQDRKSVV